MNLNHFLQQVDGLTKEMSKEKLMEFIHLRARILSERERQLFLEQLSGFGKKTTSAKKESNKEITDDKDIKVKIRNIKKDLDRIQEGELCIIGNLNECYDDWYDTEEEEFLFEDPNGVVDIIENACLYVHKCVDQEFFKEAFELADILLTLPIQVEGDYAEYEGEELSVMDLEDEKLISYNMRDFMLDFLYAAYHVEALEYRPETLYSIICDSQYNDLKIEELMQKGDKDLIQLEDFLKLWIQYLGNQSGGEAERLLKEAVSLTNDSEQALELARKYAKEHPGLYEQILNDPIHKYNIQKQFAVGQEAVSNIPQHYIIRSRIALLTAEYALQLGKREEAEKCWLEAYRSNTRPIHFLRIAVNAGIYGQIKEEMINIYNGFSAQGMRDYYYSSMVAEEKKENRINNTSYYTLLFLGGEFERVIREGMNTNKALGWSSTFMKQGMALFLLYFYNGDELPKGCSNMCNNIVQSISFTTKEYMKGLPDNGEAKKDADLFWKCFKKWREVTAMPDEIQINILSNLEQWIEKRIEGIIKEKRRNYYDECAAFVAALGEVKESRGEKNGKRYLLEQYKSLYPRHSAFRRELDAFK